MRLLQRNIEGGYSLVEFIGDAIPRYAVLSHTWGADHEEVTLKDLRKGTGATKTGHKKIDFCADQAADDGLSYFWVDTCCIDKSSSAELSEAINSMFAWYHNAARCYVYLPDVSTQGSASNTSSQPYWHLAFQQSRWFTRGWTLQELIAPVVVEFFSVEGHQLGNKYSLLQELHSITGISVQVLQGCPLSRLSIDERMSWVGNRNTKREEDAAYSLLGIFDVSMPLIYGEGRKKAFARLRREIDALSPDTSLSSDLWGNGDGAGYAKSLDQVQPQVVPADLAIRPDPLEIRHRSWLIRSRKSNSTHYLTTSLLTSVGYYVREGTDAHNFFTVGRVFETEDLTLLDRLNYRTRHFVIVGVNRPRRLAYACAITTHGGKGVLKPGCKAAEHTIVYFEGTNPTPLAGEREKGMTKDPIMIQPTEADETMHPASRLHCERLHSIRWNVKSKDLGIVAEHDRAKLKQYVAAEQRKDFDPAAEY